MCKKGNIPFPYFASVCSSTLPRFISMFHSNAFASALAFLCKLCFTLNFSGDNGTSPDEGEAISAGGVVSFTLQPIETSHLKEPVVITFRNSAVFELFLFQILTVSRILIQI